MVQPLVTPTSRSAPLQDSTCRIQAVATGHTLCGVPLKMPAGWERGSGTGAVV